jgi:agmatine deiminase
MTDATPAAEGFVMPPEWADHERCWMAWPSRPGNWGDRLEAARDAFAEIARAIAEYEPVTIVAAPADMADASLRCGKTVDILMLDVAEAWMRDTGPTFVTGPNGELAGVDWQFNGWGGKVEGIEVDKAATAYILDRLRARRFPAPIVLEGGAIHVNGAGSVLTTESVLLNPNRNPGLGKPAAEAILRDYLGIGQVVWLGAGYTGDDTDGHIDNLACFAGPNRILAIDCTDESDPNFPVFQDNMARLKAATDVDSRVFDIVPVPQPRARMAGDRRLTLSYLNFYLAGRDGDLAVVMPSFDDPCDNVANDIIAAAFPGRTVVQLPASDIVLGGGGIHCITQQQPAVATPLADDTA